MFLHIVIYKIKYILTDKDTLFWITIFPFVLATLFFITLNNVSNSVKLEKIDLGIVRSEYQDELIKILEDSNMFNLNVLSEEEAKDSLNAGKLVGYVTNDENIKLFFQSNGIFQNISKFILDSYIQTTSTIQNIIIENPDVLTNGFFNELPINKTYSTPKNLLSNTNVTVVFFYALIGMAVMFGASHSINDVKLIQANQSSIAARISIAPINPSKIFFYTLTTSLVFHTLSLWLMFLYLNNILKVDFGNQVLYILVLITVGCFTSIMIGAFLASIIKGSYNLKNGVLIAFTMLCSFLAGMNSTDIKMMVMDNAKFLTYINPVGLISDGLYALYYYGPGYRFYLSLSILIVLGILSSVGTFFAFRRQEYASI